MTESQPDLSDADRAIVDALDDGGNLTKGALVDATEYSRNTVYTRLELLQAAGIVECIHEPTRLFTLAADGTEPSDAGGRVPNTDSPFGRSRELFNTIDPTEVGAFVAGFARNGDGVNIHFDASGSENGIDRQLNLMAAYMRALASTVDEPVDAVADVCRDRATNFWFDDGDGGVGENSGEDGPELVLEEGH